MSELNRMLSDLSTPDLTEKKISVDPIPSSWGFRFTRVALALVAIAASASALTWTITTVDNKITQYQAIRAQAALEAAQKAHEKNQEELLTDSPTQKVSLRDIAYVISAITEARKMGMPQHIEPSASAGIINSANAGELDPTRTVPAPVVEASSLKVESVELTGPQLAQMSYEKAQKSAQAGNTQQAIAQLYDAVQYHPHHIGAINQLAGLLYGRNRISEAEHVLRKGIKSNPASADLRLTLARIYEQTDRDANALTVLSVDEKVLDSDQLRLVGMRAGLAQKTGKYSIAKASYQWLTRIEPHDGRWWLGLGIAAERDNDMGTAKQAYQKAENTAGLSEESVQFARQRLAYLQNQPAKGTSNGY